MRLDLGEFEVRVVGVHGVDLFTRRRADYLDNFNELVNVGLARKDWGAEQHFSEHAAKGPHINRWGIIGRSEYELRGTIVATADVGDVGLAFDELLGAEKEVRKGKGRSRLTLVRGDLPAEVTQLDNMCIRIKK